jgi:hypothetical protein
MWLLRFPVNDVALTIATIAPHQVLGVATVSSDDALNIGKALYVLFFAFRLVMRLFGRPLRSSWLTLLIVVGAMIFGFSAKWKSPSPTTTEAPAAPSPLTTDQMRNVQTVITNYMYAHASSPASIQFQDWSGLENHGSDWSVIVRYKVLQRSGDWTNATVRFTIHGGIVTDARVLRQS